MNSAEILEHRMTDDEYLDGTLRAIYNKVELPKPSKPTKR